jgi:DNA-binding beta-propeller fold protein YncE
MRAHSYLGGTTVILKNSLRAALLCGTMVAGAGVALANDGPSDNTGVLPVPTGQFITPTFAAGSTFQTLNPSLPSPYNFFRPDGAISSALSPDGSTLLVVTSGYNTLNDPSGNLLSPSNGDTVDGASEYIFVYDVTTATKPKLKAVLRPPNTFVGLAWTSDSKNFYISGGNDDVVYEYAAANIASGWSPSATISLGHGTNGIGLGQYPQAGGISVASDNSVVAVANTLNDSFSLVDQSTNTLIPFTNPAPGTLATEYDLRPWATRGTSGVPGGETVYSLAVVGKAGSYRIFATALRDRQVSVVDVKVSGGQATATFKGYVSLSGAPNNIILNAAQTTAYVSEDNQDRVAVINTATGALESEIDAIAPTSVLAQSTTRYTGAATNNVALSHDEKTLYVTNGGQNALAIIPLNGSLHPAALVPTGWYPTTVAVSRDDSVLWVFNNKSDPGANPAYATSSTYDLYAGNPPIPPYPYPQDGNSEAGDNEAQNQAYFSNEYDELREQSGLLTLPVPVAKDYATLTQQVALNNGYTTKVDLQDKETMTFLHNHIKHIIYIVKENRTFDQVLGDLGIGSDGDPSLTVFGKTVTPNFHAISKQFVTLDNFFCTAEVSGNGWPWSTEGRETDWNEKNIPMDYAFDVTRYNAPYDAEGQNRNVTLYATLAAREKEDPAYAADTAGEPGGSANVLPGLHDDGAADGPNDQVQGGHLWDAVLKAGLTFRDYGFLSDNDLSIPEFTDPLGPYETKTQVQFPANQTLALPGNFDPYFRGFDNTYPDLYRFAEFRREFEQFDANNTMPNLVMLRYMHDHMGNFSAANKLLPGSGNPEFEQADNDAAVGLTLQLVAQSKHYARNTLFIIVEDDAQDGPDHEDAHRSTAYVVGPYVKTKAVVSTRYSTVNAVRTIEDILGLEHLNLNTAYQHPMTDVFDIGATGYWDYTPVISTYVTETDINLSSLTGDENIKFAEGPAHPKPTHEAAWWAAQTKGFDWSKEDRVPTALFNRIIWTGMKGDVPYPAIRTHVKVDLHAATNAAKADSDD